MKKIYCPNCNSILSLLKVNKNEITCPSCSRTLKSNFTQSMFFSLLIVEFFIIPLSAILSESYGVYLNIVLTPLFVYPLLSYVLIVEIKVEE
jgi:hypothetical protein